MQAMFVPTKCGRVQFCVKISGDQSGLVLSFQLKVKEDCKKMKKKPHPIINL